MNIDQITWNILFEWITGTRCFLPEGCSPPLIGIIVYLLLLLPFMTSFYYFYKTKIKGRIQEWRK